MKECLILDSLILLEESGSYTQHHCENIIFPAVVDLLYRDDYEYPSCYYQSLRNPFFLPSLNLKKIK